MKEVFKFLVWVCEIYKTLIKKLLIIFIHINKVASYFNSY